MSTRTRAIPALVMIGALALSGSTGCSSVIDTLLTQEVDVSTDSLTFSATAGGANPATQTFTASCTELDTSGYGSPDCYAEITTEQGWISFTPNEIDGEDTITVTITTTGLSAGTHTGNIHVEALMPSIDDEADVAVTLTLAEPAATDTVGAPPEEESATKAIEGDDGEDALVESSVL